MRALAIFLFASAVLWAQQVPHAGYVYPAGARRGTTVEVRAGGQFLNNTGNAYISGRGVEVKVVEFVKPLTGAEAQKLRDERQKLNEKKTASVKPPSANAPKVEFTAADEQRVKEINDKLEEVQRRNSIPSIAETVILNVTVAEDAPLGLRQLRLEAAGGLTNPVAFAVGDLPEVARKPARVAPFYNVVNGAAAFSRFASPPTEPPTDVANLPVVLNGQMMPGKTDQYRFRAKKGQQIVLAANARELIPYLSDAVPGWFQAALTLRDSQGKELAAADHFEFHPDPMLMYVIPSDGEYLAEIHDSIYRGREDFVYRLTIGELPLITSIFPLGGKAGMRVPIETHGWNLPATRLIENFKGKPAGLYSVQNRPFLLDSLPEPKVKPGIGRREKAQQVKLPVILNGRIGQPGETQFFRFKGGAGEEIVAEVQARRLGSPLDSVLRLMDATGKQLATNDDFEDPGAGLLTHQADSFLSFKLPASGTYYLQIADAQHKAGSEYAYRLRISHPRPDFDLRVTPASLNVRAGSTLPITVYALRRDGFSDEIRLKLKDAPADFLLSGAAIPAGQDKVRITLTVPKSPGPAPFSPQLLGQATIEGREVTRVAVAAEDMEQAFAYHHLVAADAWMVRVIGSGAGPQWRARNDRVKLSPGATTRIDLFVPPRLTSGVKLALNAPPEGISIQSVSPDRNGVSVELRVEGDKAKPGLKGNLILEASRDVPATPGAGNQARRRQPLGMLPAVPFEIVEPAPRRK